MGSPTYRATDGALSFDAYYKDEWGVVNSSGNCSANAAARDGFHKNVFTTVSTAGGGMRETASTFSAMFTNKANPNTNAGLKDKSNPVPQGFRDDFHIHCFFSKSVLDHWKSLASPPPAPGKQAEPAKPWTKPVNLTLYFGVGAELNRHGIRSFFDKLQDMQGFMLVEGIEDPQFGVAIDDAQIRSALATFFGTAVPYRIKVLAAFSTGGCGLNQALLNDLVDVSTVERLVYFDCLYSRQCGDTATAIRNLKGKADSKLKIVVYKASECANSFKEQAADCPDTLKTRCGWFKSPKCLDFNRMSVVVDNKGLIDAQGIVSNLFQNTSYIALSVFRALEGAVADGVVALASTHRPAFDDMAALVASVPRGTVVSSKACFKFVHGSLPATPHTLFEDWSAANSKVLNAFARKLGTVATAGSFRQLLWGNFLPGWKGGDGEEKHDLLIPEFGWEYLPF